MGIPKFFRYISERYPLTSQLIQENKIPEFDNLYLDFNGIIHNCSHPNDEDAHFRLSEEQIFTSIFAYVDLLFGKIKPKKLFFMAVDGVAPRAKMNQQRSRRFRTAKEAKEVREKAERKGEVLPPEKAFDSNCITPGTLFMTKLTEQLRYFINKKITEDSNWRDVQVVLSGHDVPGEGEHKIMEYIRLSRAQPDHNPNIRHCLYGLDADLIMLGLLSHDPHFCLLREEVKFGPSSRKKSNASLESLNFYLLHLSLMREYLNLEFQEIEPVLPFQYSLERVIDDFILLAVFVGNDFLPNLPDLHIHENGLERLFDVYKKVLPSLDGYLNESGTINTKRLQIILDQMTIWEREVFEKEYADLVWYKGKIGMDEDPGVISYKEEDEEPEGEESDSVPQKSEKAQAMSGDEGGGFDATNERLVTNKMKEWKTNYYKGKLEISFSDPDEMGELVFRYVEGLQWVMHYYYSGVASWGWFYDYHYAPRISDLRDVDEMTFEFELGTPFKPFQQLMGVLPAASTDLIPLAYQDLMFDPNSPILDFYPIEFEQDLNGKKQDWEAIVKIPFIDEERLLKAMASRDHRLTPGENLRNSFGTSTIFKYNLGGSTVYPSSLPGFFPPIYRCTCIMEPFDLPTLDGLHLVPGLSDGVFLGAEALAGFPSLQTLPHTAQLGFHGVNIHGSESRNKSMVVYIQNPHENRKSEDIAKEMVGKRTFIGWPFLQEGSVVAVSDSLFKYEQITVVPGSAPKIISNPHAQNGLNHWKTKAERIEQTYSKKCGVKTGHVDVLVHVQPLKGLKRLENGAFVKDYEGPDKEIEQAVQMVLSEVASEDPRFIEKDPPPLSEEFPDGSKIFFLGEHAYGTAAQVSSTDEKTLAIILAFLPSDKTEREKFKQIVENRSSSRYFPSFKAAEMIGISGRALGKITSSFMVLTSDNQKSNLGLSLKFEAKGLKVIDYSRKDGRVWEYSDKAIELIREYKNKYPEIFQTLNSNGDEMARASDLFQVDNPDNKVKEIKFWLKTKGVRDFEPVSLFSDQLTKEVVNEIEKLADSINANLSTTAIKKAIVKNIPRHAVLKPEHAIYRLQNQHFALGDRVTMVQDSGSVPLGIKGVVVGLNSKTMDVVCDAPFMSGVTLGDRCSQYRGATVDFNSCLNLSHPQFLAPTHPTSQPPPRPTQPFRPQFGPQPAIRPPPGQAAAAGFRPAPPSQSNPMHIMPNPNRGRGGPNGRGHPVNGRGALVNGRGGSTGTNGRPVRPDVPSGDNLSAPTQPSDPPPVATSRGRGGFYGSPRGGGRGRGQGFFEPRGRGFVSNSRPHRGRGRGTAIPPLPS